MKIRKKALAVIDKELDIVRFLRKTMVTYTLIKSITNKYQRALARRTTRLVVNEKMLDSEGSETESDYDFSNKQPETELDYKLYLGIKDGLGVSRSNTLKAKQRLSVA